MKLKTKVMSAAVLSALGLATSAQAVTLGDDGRGQVLLYPYYSVQGTMDTLVSVVNTTILGKAVKVRFLEGKNSLEVLDFNLYLSPNDVWTGAITRDASGNAVLRTGDTSCTAPAITGDIPFRNFVYSGFDRAGSGLDRAREGYMEIIEMGTIPVTSGLDINPAVAGVQELSAAVTHVSGTPPGCAAVVAAWGNGGAFAVGPNNFLIGPSGGLTGSASLINVPEGIDYSYDPVALDAFRAAPIHTNPGNTFPALSDADTTSVVFNGTNIPLQDAWPLLRGQDAVSAVLMRETVFNTYTTEPVLNAGTDWVVNFPTKRFYVVRESDPVLTDAPFTVEFDDRLPIGVGDSGAGFVTDGQSTGACELFAPVVFNREEGTQASGIDFSPLPPAQGASLCWEVNIVTFNSSNVLASANLNNLNSPFANGWASFNFNGGAVSPVILPPGRTLTGSVNTFRGLPVIGFAVEKYFPGGAADPGANYGASFIHKYRRNAGPATGL